MRSREPDPAGRQQKTSPEQYKLRGGSYIAVRRYFVERLPCARGGAERSEAEGLLPVLENILDW